ncbi:MAG TPA: hypothetical protein VNU44_23165 [Bryobacteraceae bacterium]|nr:hypothetical protein [Bryobacteraceae bacterium]
MRVAIFLAGYAFLAGAPPDAFDRLKALAGEWEADLPGFGKLTDSIRLVSNGKAIEETLGTPADNEVSIYTRDNNRILLTHVCALTPDGHVARLETGPLRGAQDRLTFVFTGAANLHSSAAPHMRLVVMTLTDRDHFSEKWTKTESGKDTVFDLNWVRR